MDGENVQKTVTVRCKDCGLIGDGTRLKSLTGSSRLSCTACESTIVIEWNKHASVTMAGASAVGKPCHVGNEVVEIIVRYDPRKGYIPYVGATGKKYNRAEVCEILN